MDNHSFIIIFIVIYYIHIQNNIFKRTSHTKYYKCEKAEHTQYTSLNGYLIDDRNYLGGFCPI